MGAIDWGAVQQAGQPAGTGAIDWNAVSQAQSSAPEPAKAAAPAPSDASADLVDQETGGVSAADLHNAASGVFRGASRIGNTLMTPVDWAYDRATGNGAPTLSGLVTGKQPQTTHQWRTQALEDFFRQNADQDSLAYKAGDLGAQVAGTAGIGSGLAVPVRAAGSAFPALANIAPRIATALETGGFRTGTPALPAVAPLLTRAAQAAGNLTTRAGAGATVGGASGYAVSGDPSQALTGAALGASIPGASSVIGPAARTGSNTVGTVLSQVLGKSTGTGADAVAAAYQAGRAGDQAFLDNMTGKVDPTDVLDQARAGLAQMRSDRGAQYRAGMAQVSGDKSVLDFQPIQDAVNSVVSRGSYKGQQINANAASVVQQLQDQIGKWGSLNPAEFHTPEGLDALKQAVGDIRDSTQFGTPGRTAADTVYNAVKGQIVKQAPVYDKVMSGYSDATQQLSEITKALSLGDKTSADTAMRKLQSVLRNNVNSNYGNREQLVNTLQDQGGVSLIPSLAGQAMNSWTPRGLTGGVEFGAGGLAAIMHPHLLAAAPFISPRIVGSAAYGAGRLASAAPNAMTAALARLGTTPAGLLNSASPYTPLLTTAPAVMNASQR
jgi:hypothetical protein